MYCVVIMVTKYIKQQILDRNICIELGSVDTKYIVNLHFEKK